jgi:hypothetical protein
MIQNWMLLLIAFRNSGKLAFFHMNMANNDRDLGYSCHDIISTMFRVTKSLEVLSEHAKLEFIRVSSRSNYTISTNSILGNWIHAHENS